MPPKQKNEAPAVEPVEQQPEVAAAEPAELTPKQIQMLPPIWVRYNQQPDMPAGAMVLGPFPAPDGAAKERFEPGKGRRVNGMWAHFLANSPLAYMVEFSTEPFPEGT